MSKFRILSAILAVVALAMSGHGFKVTNVTNDEVVFQCGYEKGGSSSLLRNAWQGFLA